jgi:hypothetical protein
MEKIVTKKGNTIILAGESERDQYLADEMKLVADLYRTRSRYKRNRGWKAKRYKAIAYGMEKAMEILKRYGTELDLDL